MKSEPTAVAEVEKSTENSPNEIASETTAPRAAQSEPDLDTNDGMLVDNVSMEKLELFRARNDVFFLI